MPIVETTNEAYHADFSRDSNSSLSLFRKSRERYAAIRVFKTMQPDSPTPAMTFGTAFGYYLMEPEKFASRYVMMGKFDRRTTKGKEAAAAFESENAGKASISADDMILLADMSAGVYRNPKARAALGAPGRVECSVMWTDQDTGLPLKCRPDKLLNNGLIWDLKTTDDSSPEAFARTCVNFGYHRQAAFYLDGCWQEGQHYDGPFMFVAVSKEPPHETVCLTLDAEALALGRKQNTTALRELAECKRTGNWAGKWRDKIIETSLPRYAFYGD